MGDYVLIKIHVLKELEFMQFVGTWGHEGECIKGVYQFTWQLES